MCHLPCKIRGKLIVYEDFLVEGSGQAFPGEPDQLRLIWGKSHACVQLVRRYYIGALITVVVSEELVEYDRQIEARHDVDIR